MKFIIIKKTFNDSKMLIDILKNLLGMNIKYEENDKYLIIFHDYSNDDDIVKVLNSLGDDLMINIVAYLSSPLFMSKSKEEQSVILPILDNNQLKSGVYNLKSLLLERPTINNKRQLLNFILDSSGVDESFVRDFALNNLNVSKASKATYIHRNTMIYKLDKLKDISGFDLRLFLDAYILFGLIEK